MGKENLFQELKAAKKAERSATAKYYKMLSEMNRELANATKPIKEKYEPILEALCKNIIEENGKIWHIGGNINNYGSFYRYDIVNIVAVFLSYIEGESYIPFSSIEANQNSIIIKEEVSKQNDRLDYNILDMLYKNGDLIMLDDGFSSVVDFFNNVGDPKSSFGSFDYMREFVNRLVQYRIDNKKYSITAEELYTFMCNFILTHPELAQKNKDKREQMLSEQNEADGIVSECKKLEVSIKK